MVTATSGTSVRTPDIDDLMDLRREMVGGLSVVVAFFAWIFILVAVGPDGRTEQLGTAVILIGCAVVSRRSRQSHPQVSGCTLVAGVIAAVAFQQVLAPTGRAQDYYAIAVVLSSLLMPSAGVFVTTGAASALCLALARQAGISWLDERQVVMPLLVTFAAALAGWLGTRQLHGALGWLQSSYTTTRDLLEQLRDERLSLATANRTLEQAYIRIDTMNRALVEARSIAEQARRLKADFAASVSHELRTPLSIIVGFSETMANAAETYRGVTWSPTLRGDVEQIYQSSRHLSALIDDILDLSALDAHQLGLAFEESDLRLVIDEAIRVVQRLFVAKQLSVMVDAPHTLPRLRMDTTRIRQVLINLLTNASRFTEAGGVTVSARLIGQDVEIAVRDTGIGIAPEDVASVFEDFGQVHGLTDGKPEGTGLGVPISKRLVELHGGRMWLESARRCGTTFFFTIPVGAEIKSEPPRPTASLRPPTTTCRRSLLVVEPAPFLLRTLRRHLEGFDIVDCSADHVRDFVERHHPVALLVASSLAGRRILLDASAKQLPRDLPTITISVPNVFQVVPEVDVRDVLVKPVARERLLGTMCELGASIREILIVVHDPGQLELLSRMLQTAGGTYRVTATRDASQALNHLRHQRVDVVVVDISATDEPGLAVIRTMKADPLLAQVAVVALSDEQVGTVQSEPSLRMTLSRPKPASVSESLSYLHALVSALPPRGLPAAGEEQPSPGALSGPLAS